MNNLIFFIADNRYLISVLLIITWITYSLCLIITNTDDLINKSIESIDQERESIENNGIPGKKMSYDELKQELINKKLWG